MSELYKSILSKGSKMDFHLIPMKKTRKKPKTGDVFIVQPIEGVYYYGKVIEESHDCSFQIGSGWPLIYLYEEHSNELIMPETLSNILVAPLITNYRPWSMGYLYTIGNIPVTKKEMELDCGFEDCLLTDFNYSNCFYRNVKGEKINHKPKYTTIFGLSSFSGINYELCKALGIE